MKWIYCYYSFNNQTIRARLASSFYAVENHYDCKKKLDAETNKLYQIPLMTNIISALFVLQWQHKWNIEVPKSLQNTFKRCLGKNKHTTSFLKQRFRAWFDLQYTQKHDLSNSNSKSQNLRHFTPFPWYLILCASSMSSSLSGKRFTSSAPLFCNSLSFIATAIKSCFCSRNFFLRSWLAA